MLEQLLIVIGYFLTVKGYYLLFIGEIIRILSQRLTHHPPVLHCPATL